MEIQQVITQKKIILMNKIHFKPMRFNLYSFILLAVCATGTAQVTQPVEFFDLDQVSLLDSPFYKAAEKDKEYLLKTDPDRLLAPYFKEAGLTPKGKNYPNWESTGLDGHIGGHYVSALALMYATTADPQILQRLNYMLDGLELCQNTNGNGYISGVPNGKVIWQEIAAGNIRAGSFGLNDRWVPLYNIHKTYSGLRDAYQHANNNRAKTMLIALTDWMITEVKNLSDEQIQQMLISEHGGLNEVFADVYYITGEQKYLDLAKKFSHQAVLEPLLHKQDKLTGIHANTQIPKVIGFKRIADLEHNAQWNAAADYFWHNVTDKRSVAIGGNSVSEHFNPIDDFSSMVKSIEGPETCNTYNMLKLTKELFGSSGESSYADYYERALYNHILSSQHTENGGFVYFTPMRPGHYRVYSQPETSFWCCVGSGMENHAKYGEFIYAHTDDELYVNLFIPSKVRWSAKKVAVVQENNFPEVPETKFTVTTAGKTAFTFKLRCPEWTDEKEVLITINGKKVTAKKDASGYFALTRKWKSDDVVVMHLPMHIAAEQLPDKSDYYAFKYGPVVLAAVFNDKNQDGLFANDSRGGHIAHGPQVPLNEMPVVLGEASSILGHVSAGSSPLNFRLTGLYPQQYEKGFNLVPFYQIQGKRYILYWPQADADKVAALQQQKAREEEVARKINAITVDRVALGEQQPEADHFIESKDAYTGYMEDRHYRDARGWFSFEMKDTYKTAKYIYITYFDADRNRQMNIEVNGKSLITKTLEGKSGSAIQQLLLPLPKSEAGKEKFTIKFTAGDNSLTSKIVEVRLVSQEVKPSK